MIIGDCGFALGLRRGIASPSAAVRNAMRHPLEQPLRFEPWFRPMVWGGRKIGRFLGKPLPTPDAYGESWEVSDHPLHVSRAATNAWFGDSLRQLMEGSCRDLLGSAADRFNVFPWLIKLIDAKDWLSVQVHPDEEAVQRLRPGEGAKTEAWYILDAEPTSRIYAGLKPGISGKIFRQAIEGGAVVDCLHSFTPMKGDLVFLPAGTVHAVGGGVLLAEIQQTSDVTFRLYDWDRTDAHGKSRPLHIGEALASMNWDQGAVQPTTERLRCPYFDIEPIRWTGKLTVGGAGRLQALVVAEGNGRFENGEYVLPGDVWILPSAMRPMTMQLDCPLTGLLATLP